MSSIPTNQTTPPAPLLTAHVRPDCPALTKEQTAWLNKNTIMGYAQTVAAAQAQSSNSLQVQGLGTKYVKEHVLNACLEEFWTPDNELKTVSVLLVSIAYYSPWLDVLIWCVESQKVPCKPSQSLQWEVSLQPSYTDTTSTMNQHQGTVLIGQGMGDQSRNGKMFTWCPGGGQPGLILWCVLGYVEWAWCYDYWGISGYGWWSQCTCGWASEPEWDIWVSEHALTVRCSLIVPLHRNQSLTDQAMTLLLECLIGFGPGQLGKVAWIAHCLYEDADGKVCTVKWVSCSSLGYVILNLAEQCENPFQLEIMVGHAW